MLCIYTVYVSVFIGFESSWKKVKETNRQFVHYSNFLLMTAWLMHLHLAHTHTHSHKKTATHTQTHTNTHTLL